tara:strand:- start:180148 stop:180441 length:294 start_codon:yes stop_codon:yes gene_type:complete
MKKNKEIFEKANKKSPVVVYDYSQIKLMYQLAESLKVPKTIFTEEEAADYLRVELQTLKNYAKKKKITWKLIGKDKIYTQKDLDEFLERKSRFHQNF